MDLSNWGLVNVSELLYQYQVSNLLSSIMCLQASAVEQFTTWHNPLELLELKVPDEEKVFAWHNQVVTEKQWREYARLAWEVSPTLTVFFPSRYDLKLHLNLVNLK